MGGKEYTGPKEQPAAEVVPTPKPETKPETKPEIKPEAKPAPKPVTNISPESNSAPHPSLNIAPINTQNIAPNPAPNMQMEVAPVQEIEMQSLFVQITVPNQEPVAQQEAPKAEKKQTMIAHGIIPTDTRDWEEILISMIHIKIALI